MLCWREMALAEIHPARMAHSMAAYGGLFIQICEGRDRVPVGIQFMGGIALFNTELSLSVREQQCAGLAVIGNDNTAIGNELYLSEDTVKTHLHRMFRKISSVSRAHVLDRCLEPEEDVLVLARTI